MSFSDYDLVRKLDEMQREIDAMKIREAAYPLLATYTPTLTTASGAFSNATATGARYVFGKLCYVAVTVTITTNGTAVGVKVSLPSATSGVAIIAGRENSVTGDLLQGVCSGTVMDIYDYGGGYVNADGRALYMSGIFPMA